MGTENTVIVGNALAGMLAALDLAKQGHPVTLINPGGPLGGYFAGIEIDGVMFDAGLVKFELDSYADQVTEAELSSYDPKRRNDIGRFLNIIHRWAEQYVPLHQFDMPKMWFEDKVYDDIVLSNAYHTFHQLPFAETSIQELKSSHPPADIHAREKANGKRYETLDYATASIANHGKTMHEKIIAAYLKKAHGVTADQVLARYHRVPWLPLFYPETLLESFQGHAVPLKPTVFHYPKYGAIGGIVKQIKQQLLTHPRITYLAQPVLSVQKTDAGWSIQTSETTIHGHALAWTGAPAMLLKALGHQPTPVKENKSKVALLFLRIPKSAIRDVYTLLHVLDLDKCIYRITNQTAGAGNATDDMNIVVEYNEDYFEEMYGRPQEDAWVIEKLVNELKNMQLITEDAAPMIASIKRVPGGFLVPDAAARDAWESDHRRVMQLAPDIALLAMSSGFFATSLNDQVIQGKYYALTRTMSLPKISKKEVSYAA